VNDRQGSASPNKDTPTRRSLFVAAVKPLVTVSALIVGYYLLPVARPLDLGTLAILIVSLCVVVVLIVWETRTILRARHPTLQGVHAVALIVPLFLLVFANIYYVVAYNQADSFSAPLTRTDALYFVVTVFATVGFGDIAPVTQVARILVMFQMLGDLVLLGGVLRVILTAVERGRQRTAGDPGKAGR
jgi:voltage-gated potassium channel